MKLTATYPLLVTLALAACGDGTNPFDPDEPEEEPAEITHELLPGTENPTPDSAITRYEAPGTGGGAGTATGFAYNAGDDTFYVDNLPFDGDNSYRRGTTVSTLGGGAYQVYENDPVSIDPQTGNPINNFTYRALYGKSTTGQTEFAIVRSGSYAGFGFGGFIYHRNATDNNGDPVSLVVPNCTGDCSAQYTGSYAGVRVFNGRGGIEYSQGDAEMVLDFEDFNSGQTGAVLYVRNRRLFDSDGNDVTAAYLTALEDVDDQTTIVNTGGGARIPNMVSVIANNNADPNGEIVGEMTSQVVNSDGTVVPLESGNYYAVLSGTDASEIVGVVVVESDDPRLDGSQVQETGGFILYRN